MSVYNTKSEFLIPAIDSILNQSFTDFEFLIVNDGSNSKTTKILENYCDLDSRIVVINNKENIGLTKSLNKALKVAKGKYIARMDSDDVSLKNRLLKQYEYLEKRDYIDILGSWVKIHGHIECCGGNLPFEWRWVRMLFGNHGVVHSSAIIRKSFLDKNKIVYDENFPKAQDYKLWVDCLEAKANMAVLPQVLVKYRIHNEQISYINSDEQIKCAETIRTELVKRLYPDISELELNLFLRRDTKRVTKHDVEKLIGCLESRNSQLQRYNNKLLHFELMSFLGSMSLKDVIWSLPYQVSRRLYKLNIVR